MATPVQRSEASEPRESSVTEEPLETSLRAWWPALAWAVAIFFFSTGSFSSDNTLSVLQLLAGLIFPGASSMSLALANDAIRKFAHFFNYALLYWLIVRRPMRQRAWLALVLCVLYAFSDEGHQLFVPGRTPSLYDVALDSSGALASRLLWALLSS